MTTSTASAAARGRIRLERGAKRVRVVFNGQVIADTTKPMYVWESPHYPTYYLPLEDVAPGVLEPTGRARHSPSRGDGGLYTVRVGDREAIDAALRHAESPIEELRGLVRFEWDAMDEWLEEDEPVYVHVRSPYTRVDVLASSRHVRVEVDGVTVAESTRPHVLFETGLPPRYYLPMTDVRLDLLRRTSTVSHCPYKGKAEYWSVSAGDTIRDDVVWTYRTPLPESAKIAGLLSFWTGKPGVTVYVDGEPVE
ncbi:DUF427 domain-containing protein [Phytohabitans kaempferiae]|uniref:DUF427 domain-containing protein n=1 Tax=Phytohabitans kaempferiae TaxID=1620943 RepID=A0ABV6M2D4_9ACTN